MGPPPLSFPKTPKTNTNQIFVTKSVVYTKNTMTCTKTTYYTDGAIFFFIYLNQQLQLLATLYKWIT